MMKFQDSYWQGDFGYWQKSFIHSNLMMIGYSAWQGFLQNGRGVLVCEVDRMAIAPSNSDLEVKQFRSKFIAAPALAGAIQVLSQDQDLLAVLLQTVQTYIPEREIVLLIKMEDHIELNLFQNLKIFPPECHSQVSRRWEEFQPCLESQTT